MTAQHESANPKDKFGSSEQENTKLSKNMEAFVLKNKEILAKGEIFRSKVNKIGAALCQELIDPIPTFVVDAHCYVTSEGRLLNE